MSIFKNVELNIMQEMLSGSSKMQFSKGAFLLSQDDQISKYYVVLEGWCGVCGGNEEGQETVLQLFRQGEFITEPFINREHFEISTVSVQALTQVSVLSIPVGAVNAAQKNSIIFASNMLNMCSERCRELRYHIEGLTLKTATQRVGRFLLKLRFMTDPNGQDIVLPFDKSYIASYLGIKPETLSRTLQTFKDKGFIVTKGSVIMPSTRALCEFCDKGIMNKCSFSGKEECPLCNLECKI
ncbi:MAG: Crp/Fnr family transcriptional regulator [Alphaproteobacteria bacterium]|nr:Crp/Fnr family transcriptional regulator [Alphaproteobacteria bacterium]